MHYYSLIELKSWVIGSQIIGSVMYRLICIINVFAVQRMYSGQCRNAYLFLDSQGMYSITMADSWSLLLQVIYIGLFCPKFCVFLSQNERQTTGFTGTFIRDEYDFRSFLYPTKIICLMLYVSWPLEASWVRSL